jgi:hypothetical protein
MHPPLDRNIAHSTRNQYSMAQLLNTQSNRTHPPPLLPEDIKQVQRVIGSILYYAWTVNLTVLMALSTITSKQAKGTESMMKKMQTTPRLSCHSSQHAGTIPRIRHDLERAL